MTATVTKHYALHRKAIKADIAEDKAHWAAGEWWAAGLVTADLATLAIGPITPVYPTPTTMYPTSMVGLDVLAVPEFIAGLIFGFTGNNDLPEIEACYTGGVQVQTDASNLLADLAGKDIVNAVKHAAALKKDLSDALDTCTSINDDLVRIEDWANIFTQPAELTKTVGVNWLLHKRAIKKDIAAEKSDWAAGDYFTAGLDTADALVKLIGPVA